MIEDFIDLADRSRWSRRLHEIERQAAIGPRSGKAILQRHAVECALERIRSSAVSTSVAERCIGRLAAEAVALSGRLSAIGRARLREELAAALEGDGTLVPLFHKLRCAVMQQARGFVVRFAGLEEGAGFDLLLVRGGVEAEMVCDVISAEEGRSVQRGAWFRLADRIDPDLQTWLAAHPGRYLLKMTLPEGLRDDDAAADEGLLARLHERIRALLAGSSRADQDAAVVLRLDPLLLAGARADELGMLGPLRREFGPDAHLAMVTTGGGVFVVAARAGRENEVAAAVRRRMATIAPARLSGTRPGILAMFVEDTDRTEWRGLRDRLELEGEARQFLTDRAARAVVAVTCTSRLELFGLAEPDAAPDGELRFRNPAHPAARSAALAPAVLSSV